ncbi:5-oxoproline transporter, DUF969 family subunit [Rhodanobacter lindaniclasticus]
MPLLFVLTLPAIGLLERAGLREHAQRWMARLQNLTLARLLIGYLLLRQLLATMGLTGVAGAAQTVRPLLAPMGRGRGAEDPARSRPGRSRGVARRRRGHRQHRPLSSARTCSSRWVPCC